MNMHEIYTFLFLSAGERGGWGKTRGSGKTNGKNKLRNFPQKQQLMCVKEDNIWQHKQGIIVQVYNKDIKI